MISTSQEFSVPHGIMLHPTISKNRCFAPIYFPLAEKIYFKENLLLEVWNHIFDEGYIDQGFFI